MRRDRFARGEYYHIYCHGVGDLKIFCDKRDYERFISLLFAANGVLSVPRLERSSGFETVLDMLEGRIDVGKPLVRIVCICMMPTHFHLLLGERGGRRESNISVYLHKVLVSHSKYFNRKYERRGHVFESTFHSRHIDTNRYLLYLSRYIHKNPTDISQWKGKESVYPWSTYQDYVGENRWGGLLARSIVLDQFKSPAEYRSYMQEPASEDETEFNEVLGLA
ncbi:MAG: hypothetical protein HYT34_01530 [Candidatus Ryanbacteria bacterium]|nr:hypothetical protein [Candidatus Ryanbacteria bacterium]